MTNPDRLLRAATVAVWLVTLALVAGILAWAAHRGSGSGEFVAGAAVAGLGLFPLLSGPKPKR